MSESDFEIIAQRELALLDDSTGEKRSIVVKIGRPYWREDGLGAVCPIAITGLLEPQTDIRGVDLLHALEMALLFTDSFLSSPRAKKLIWPSGTEYQSPIHIALDNWKRELGSDEK